MGWSRITTGSPLRLRVAVALATAAAVAVGVFFLAWAHSPRVQARTVAAHAAGQAVPAAGPVVTVNTEQPGRVIPAGFMGLSFEYWALENMAGKNSRAVNPVLVRLIRQLVKPGSAQIRIGGVTTDQTWWPVPGMSTPGGVHYTLNKSRLGVARTVAKSSGARLIMGLNFEADSRAVALAESQAMLHVIGRSRIAAFELGNEPDLYAGLPWYTKNGQPVPGRGPSWSYGTFNQDAASVAGALGSDPIAGPSIGTMSWMPDLSPFLSAVPNIRLVALHRYPLQGCTVPPSAPSYPTISHLLADDASLGQAQDLAPYVLIAHAHGLPIRNDEMNTVACGNVRGVAETFASALWAMDASFQMANAGVDGINIHTAPGYSDQLFSFTQTGSHWHGLVAPEYYGLLMFAEAAPRGARILPVAGTSSTLRVWSTKTSSGRVRVLFINDDTAHPQTVTLHVGTGQATARVQRLSAPGVRATRRVTLAGQSFARNTTTGRLTGRFRSSRLHPKGGAYQVRLPAASAALLTLR
jgi:hypothetical protein